MALPVWTFEAISFYPVSSEHIAPRWKREARINVQNLIGTGLAEFSQFGYGEYRLEASIYVDSEMRAEDFEAALGTSGTLVMNGTTFTDVMVMAVDMQVRAPTHAEGTVTFARSGTS